MATWTRKCGTAQTEYMTSAVRVNQGLIRMVAAPRTTALASVIAP
ncbi:hypothetical protein ACFVVM_07140 [Nocardia sp. NPDC058176]